MKKVVICMTALAAVIGFSNCGGGGSSSDVRNLTGNTLVDPYVVGAVLFEDINGDGVQDVGDQVSSATDANGIFSFTNALTTGSVLRLATNGTHNGLPFTGGLTRKVEAGDTGFVVVSPLTTLLNNGWTGAQIVSVLSEAGLTGITEDDLKKDPMATFNLTDTSSTITDAKLERLRASICIYNLLSVVSSLINDQYALPYSTFTQHPEWKTLLTNMVEQVKAGLSKAAIENIDSRITSARGQCPWTVAEVTIEDIIRGSVAIADFVAAKTIVSCQMSNDKNVDGYPDCDYNAYTQATSDFNEWKNKLGESFYSMRTASNQCTQYAATHGYIENAIGKTECHLVDGSTVTVSCN